MLTTQLAGLLKAARRSIGLSQKELARRAGVSTRLCAEVERGERPNVSLETALRLLGEVGVTIRVVEPSGVNHELGLSSAGGRAARAAVRRATWRGRQMRLSDDETGVGSLESSGIEGLAAVGRVSEQAFAVAEAQTRAPTGVIARTQAAAARQSAGQRTAPSRTGRTPR